MRHRGTAIGGFPSSDEMSTHFDDEMENDEALLDRLLQAIGLGREDVISSTLRNGKWVVTMGNIAGRSMTAAEQAVRQVLPGAKLESYADDINTRETRTTLTYPASRIQRRSLDRCGWVAIWVLLAVFLLGMVTVTARVWHYSDPLAPIWRTLYQLTMYLLGPDWAQNE